MFFGAIEKIMAKNFWKMMKGIKPQIQEAQRNDKQAEEKTKTKQNPTQIIFKLLKPKIKRNS